MFYSLLCILVLHYNYSQINHYLHLLIFLPTIGNGPNNVCNDDILQFNNSGKQFFRHIDVILLSIGYHCNNQNNFVEGINNTHYI